MGYFQASTEISSALSVAVDHAKQGRRVALCCPPDQNGACRFPECGKRDDQHQLVPHAPKEVGKAPIGRFFPKGINDATTNTAKLDAFLRQMPYANVSVDLESTGWLVVDTDAPEAEAAELTLGLGGAVIRESRNRAYVFLRPADCPIVNLIKSEGDALDILTTGNFLVHGTHASGAPIRLDPNAKPGPAPARYVELLKAKAAAAKAQEDATAARRAERAAQYGNGSEPPVRLHRRGQERWSGELFAKTKDGKLDRDLSLFYLGLDLAECNATEGAIVAALEERDEALGWRKFTGRGDAEKRYTEIAEKAVARAIELEQAPQIKAAAPVQTPESGADLSEVIAFAEATAAENTRLRRVIHDQGDRLEILEDLVHSIDDVLNRPNEELSASEKVALVVTARWLPFKRAKQEANGKPTATSLGYVAKVAGTSKSTLSSVFKRFSSNRPEDGAPFRKSVTRKPSFDENGLPIIDPKTGRQKFESELEIMPWGNRPSETLRAAVRLAGEQTRPKHGGSQEASDARWGRCVKHDNREVRIKGYCPDCGKVVGERIMRLAEFDALNEQVAHSERPAPTVSNANLIGKQVAHSEHAHGPVERQNVQVVDSAQPLNLLDYPASRPQEPPPRCPAPGCAALGFRTLPDGSLRCLKSGHDPRVYELVPLAVRGASE